eukprot:TRINITY_DN3823_c0_g3_i1.p1 TRINITY_DN3823_c0_g3~~TRINITY_DN3823_c0_g3_i1.p1  ORF type:complete len:472 (+),score=113.64 TRINITY_DN3823_c0_g3_i1:107-1522(+)
MRSFLILFIVPLLHLAFTAKFYSIKDSGSAFKVYVSRVLEEVSGSIKTITKSLGNAKSKPSSVDILELVDNKLSKVKVKFASQIISQIKFDKADSTIIATLNNPLTCEIDSKFKYTQLGVIFDGTAKLNGSIRTATVTFKATFSPVSKDFKIFVETLDVTPDDPVVTLNPNNYLTKHFKLKELIAGIFVKNVEPVRDIFMEEMVKAADKFFPTLYRKEVNWKFGVLENTLQKDLKLKLSSIEMDNGLVLNYGIPIVERAEQEALDFKRRIVLSMDFVTGIIDEAYKKGTGNIEDKDLPTDLDDRLDMITFQKILPDAAIMSITAHGLENNPVTMTVTTTKSKLNYTLKNNILKVAAEFPFTFTNYNVKLIEGEVKSSLNVGITWTNGKNAVLNFVIKDSQTYNLMTRKGKYPMNLGFFGKFMDPLSQNFKSYFHNRRLLDEGIPMEQILVPYSTTRMVWDLKSNQITIDLV